MRIELELISLFCGFIVITEMIRNVGKPVGCRLKTATHPVINSEKEWKSGIVKILILEYHDVIGYFLQHC